MSKQRISNIERLHILLSPYVRRRDVIKVLECTPYKATRLMQEMLFAMKKENLMIFDYARVPTTFFIKYCNIDLDEVVALADIEIKMRK